MKEFVLPDYKSIKKGFARDPVNYMTLEEVHQAKKLAEEQVLNSKDKKA